VIFYNDIFIFISPIHGSENILYYIDININVYINININITNNRYSPLCTKFDNPSLSRSRDMIWVLTNLNGSHDLTTPLSQVVCYPWSRHAVINLPTKFEISNSTQYEDMKGDTKCENWGGFGSHGSLTVTGNSTSDFDQI